MRVLFVASEITPLAKVGGLADVIYSLPKALLKIGVDARVIIPKYEQIHHIGKHSDKLKFADIKKDIFIKIGKNKEKASLYKTRVDGIEIFLVENKKYLSKGPIYFSPTAFSDDFHEIQRFVFFSAAVFELLRQNLFSFKPDIIHCNDWHSGALISLIKKFDYPVKTVFTIHNLGNQGIWSAKKIEKWLSFHRNGFKIPSLSLRAKRSNLWDCFGTSSLAMTKRALAMAFKTVPAKKTDLFEKFGKNFNFMAEGIMNSDVITTVSPSYAKEILTKRYGEKLEILIGERKNKLSGILNGIDYNFFNPASDPFLFKNYSLKNPAFKKENKFFLQKECGLDVGDKNAVFGLVSRLTKQKGINLISRSCGRLIKEWNAQFVFLGRGEARYERALRKLSKKHPKNIFVKIGFDEKLAHRIYAGSDFFLMPSLFEPCGLGQMIALRYGTIPIVRATGGLKDTIKNNKNGFTFSSLDSKILDNAIVGALRLFRNKKSLEAMRRYCMRENFSWNKSAIKYKNVYKRIMYSI